MLIICCGMMRAGSTLQYNHVCGLVEKLGLGERKGHFTSGQIAEQEEMLMQWGRDTRFHVIKTHDITPKLINAAETGYARIMYIHRDIRDVAVSSKRKFKYKKGRLYKYLDALIEFYYIIDKVDDVLIQRYEDVICDTFAAIHEQAEFMSVMPAKDIILMIEKECSVENARRTMNKLSQKPSGKVKFLLDHLPFRIPIVTHKVSDRIYDDHTQIHADHLSESAGEIGLWRAELAEGEIEFITERYASWLRETGYIS